MSGSAVEGEEVKGNGKVSFLTFPQWHLPARINMWFTYLQIFSAIMGHAFFELGSLFPDPDPKEIEIFSNVRYLLVPLLFWEISFNLYQSVFHSERKNTLVISRIAIWEMCVKISYYSVLAKYNGGLVQLNVRAMGSPRPIYLPRWLGWSFAIPTLITLSNFPMMSDAPFLLFLHRMFPMLANTWAYCWTCYLGCVLENVYYGWFLIILGCVAYLSIIMDQIYFVVERIPMTPNPASKIFMILMKENMFVLYTMVWLLGEWGITSSYQCQMFYCCADLSLKSSCIILTHIFRLMDDSVENAAKKVE